MEISTKLRYGARALAELGIAYPEQVVPASKLAKRQGLSVKYLEHILSSLKAGGIITSERGMGGGYRLACAPEEITLASVFRVLEGSPAPVKCVDAPETCDQAQTCPTLPTWIELRDAVTNVLESTTIADLAQRIKDARRSEKPAYQI